APTSFDVRADLRRGATVRWPRRGPRSVPATTLPLTRPPAAAAERCARARQAARRWARATRGRGGRACCGAPTRGGGLPRAGVRRAPSSDTACAGRPGDRCRCGGQTTTGCTSLTLTLSGRHGGDPARETEDQESRHIAHGRP